MPNELGVLRLGTESDPIGIMIPPKQESFKIKSFCSNKCIGPVGDLFLYHTILKKWSYLFFVIIELEK